MAHNTNTNSIENMVSQICIAFGQGTGNLRVAASAVDVLANTYKGLAENVFERWADDGLAALDFMRDLGRDCAAKAHEAGSEWIEGEHVRDRVQVIIDQHALPCPSVRFDIHST